jgi:hypothetical protein
VERPSIPATLACVDCQFPRLAVRAMRESMAQAQFAAARFFTDEAGARAAAGLEAEVVVIPTIASSLDYSRFVLKDLLAHVATGHVQIVQWDGYVARGQAWRPDWLAYDYIGAPWWFREAPHNVGNGGFSLRSRRLLEALQDERVAVADPEDDAICLRDRPWLEREHGIRFAPAEVAGRYAFEGEWPTGAEFGFHRVFNLPYFLDEGALAEVLEPIPDAARLHAPFVTLVTKLAALGRKDEAWRYGSHMAEVDREHAGLSQPDRLRLYRALGLLQLQKR